MRYSSTVRLLPVLVLATHAAAQPAADLAVMRVDMSNPAGSGAIFIDFFTLQGVPAGDSIAFPSEGPDAVSMPTVPDFDRHLHLSMRRNVVSFGAYATPPGSTDPRLDSSSNVRRAVCAFDGPGFGTVGPRLVDAYSFCSIRAALITDAGIWTAGGNSVALSGGLRRTTWSSERSTDMNLPPPLGRDPADLRDIGVYAAQLYVSAASPDGVGEGVFAVGNGLPRNNPEPLHPLDGPGAPTSSFVFLNIAPLVLGVDVMYAVINSPGTAVQKYIRQNDGSWQPLGSFPLEGVSHVTALENANGDVTLIAGTPESVLTITDAQPLTNPLSELSLSTVIVTAPNGFSLGGISLMPIPAPKCRCDWNNDGAVNSQDFFDYLPDFFVRSADYNLDGITNSQDFFDFLTCFFNGGC